MLLILAAYFSALRCVRAGLKGLFVAELGDLTGEALGLRLGGLAVEIVHAEIVVAGSILEHVMRNLPSVH